MKNVGLKDDDVLGIGQSGRKIFITVPATPGDVVQQICDKIWLNCAFNDKSMKFGTLLEYTIMVIFGYRAIADLTCDKIGSHFPIWPPSSLGNRGFVWENCGK